MFHQCEGLVIDRGITLGHLKGCLIDFLRAFFGIATLPVRFRSSYFPFTEPSMEVDIGWNRRTGEIGAGGDWLEILGSGMVHPRVLANCGLDPREWQGFAFGMGVERVTMLKHGIPDLRPFYESDPAGSATTASTRSPPSPCTRAWHEVHPVLAPHPPRHHGHAGRDHRPPHRHRPGAGRRRPTPAPPSPPSASPTSLSAEQHPNADRLRACMVDAGDGPVSVVCGAPNARAGMKAVFAPPGSPSPAPASPSRSAKSAASHSAGMLLSLREMGLGEDHDGILELPADAPVGTPYAALGRPRRPRDRDRRHPQPRRRPLRPRHRPRPRRLRPRHAAPLVPRRRSRHASTAPSPGPSRTHRLPLGPGPHRPQRPQRPQPRMAAAPPALHRPAPHQRPRGHHQLLHLRPRPPPPRLRRRPRRRRHPHPPPRRRRDLPRPQRQGLHRRPRRTASSPTQPASQSLAGVMGGEATGCTEATTDVFIECALFDPVARRPDRPPPRHHPRRPPAVRARHRPGPAPRRPRCRHRHDHRTLRRHRQRSRLGRRRTRLAPHRHPALRPPRHPRRRSTSPPTRPPPPSNGLGFTVQSRTRHVRHRRRPLLAQRRRRPIHLDQSPTLPPSPGRRRRRGLRRGRAREPTWSRKSSASAASTTSPPSPSRPRHRPARHPDPPPGPRRPGPPHPRRRRAAGMRHASASWTAPQAAAFGPARPRRLRLAEPHRLRPRPDAPHPRRHPRPGRRPQRRPRLARQPPVRGRPRLRPRNTRQEVVAAGLLSGHTPRHPLAPPALTAPWTPRPPSWPSWPPSACPWTASPSPPTPPPGTTPAGPAPSARAPSSSSPPSAPSIPASPPALDLPGPAAAFEVFLDRIPEPKRRRRAAPDLPAFQPVRRDFAFLVAADTPADTLLRAARGADRTLIAAATLFDILHRRHSAPARNPSASRSSSSPATAP